METGKKGLRCGTDVKFRQHAAKKYPAIGVFEPNEQVKLLKTALVDGMKRYRVKTQQRAVYPDH